MIGQVAAAGPGRWRWCFRARHPIRCCPPPVQPCAGRCRRRHWSAAIWRVCPGSRLTAPPIPPVLVGRDLSGLDRLSSDEGAVALAAFDGRRAEVTLLSRARFDLGVPPAGDCARAAEAWIPALQDEPTRLIARA